MRIATTNTVNPPTVTRRAITASRVILGGGGPPQIELWHANIDTRVLDPVYPSLTMRGVGMDIDFGYDPATQVLSTSGFGDFYDVPDSARWSLQSWFTVPGFPILLPNQLANSDETWWSHNDAPEASSATWAVLQSTLVIHPGPSREAQCLFNINHTGDPAVGGEPEGIEVCDIPDLARVQ